MHKPWFSTKKYGYGWGLPQTPQGWIVFIVYIILLVLNSFIINIQTDTVSPRFTLYLTILFIITAIFLIIVYKTSEKPKWHWGNKTVNKTENCVIHCIDFRFQKHMEKWMFENGYLDKSDLIAVAGASRDLVKPLKLSHKENWLRELATSVKLHNPKNIIIIEHQDCGGYAIDKTIESNLEEQQDMLQHKTLAEKTKTLVKKIYNDKKVTVVYVNINGEFTEI